MDVYKEFLRFPDLEKAMAYTAILEENNVPFQLDESSMRFNTYSPDSPWDAQFILKIRDTDIETAVKLFNKQFPNDINSIPRDHYLYSFSDRDILDIITNPEEWSEDEVALAIKIANERNLKPKPEPVINFEINSKDESKENNSSASPDQKPRKLSIAIVLFLLVLIREIVSGIVSGYHESSTEKNHAHTPGLFEDRYYGVTLLLSLIVFVIMPIVLLYKMNKGKSWARSIFSFYITLSATYFFLYIRYYFNQNFNRALITSVETLIQLFALNLLYRKEVNAWFDFKKIESSNTNAAYKSN